MRMNSKLMGAMFACVLAGGNVQAGETILKRDVVCRNQSKVILISKDLTRAVLTQASGTTKHRVELDFQSGGHSQVIGFSISGLDQQDDRTIISDIFALDRGAVAAKRTRQVGYGFELLENLRCAYKK